MIIDACWDYSKSMLMKGTTDGLYEVIWQMSFAC